MTSSTYVGHVIEILRKYGISRAFDKTSTLSTREQNVPISKIEFVFLKVYLITSIMTYVRAL